MSVYFNFREKFISVYLMLPWVVGILWCSLEQKPIKDLKYIDSETL